MLFLPHRSYTSSISMQPQQHQHLHSLLQLYNHTLHYGYLKFNVYCSSICTGIYSKRYPACPLPSRFRLIYYFTIMVKWSIWSSIFSPPSPEDSFRTRLVYTTPSIRPPSPSDTLYHPYPILCYRRFEWKHTMYSRARCAFHESAFIYLFALPPSHPISAFASAFAFPIHNHTRTLSFTHHIHFSFSFPYPLSLIVDHVSFILSVVSYRIVFYAPLFSPFPLCPFSVSRCHWRGFVFS